MNLQQLEYIIAVDTHRQFSLAAEKCFVTQATLSMMVKKLEEELDVVIFDRSKHPVTPTALGEHVIAQARKALVEVYQIKGVIREYEGSVSGDLHIGIIPTLAPYLLPKFIKSFTAFYPLVKLKVSELLTEDIIRKLRNGQIDGGLLATPLSEKGIREVPLFYERFMLYANTDERIMKKKYVLPADLDVDRLLLLEEGHCLRNQLLNFCELKKAHDMAAGFDYEAGSIETLMKMVDQHQGITIIPELVAMDLDKRKHNRIRQFKAPVPVREISLVYHRDYHKKKLLEVLQETILAQVPSHMQQKKGDILEID